MYVVQHASFSIGSRSLSPEEISERLNVSADCTHKMGERWTFGARSSPSFNSWTMLPHADLVLPDNEFIDRAVSHLEDDLLKLSERILPIAESIRKLLSPNTEAVLMVTRSFQKSLELGALGFEIGADILSVLALCGASIGVDEYDPE